MVKRLTEPERQVLVLKALPANGDPIRVSDLCRLLNMSPRKVNIHLEEMSSQGFIDTSYFPGSRAPLRMVWLTTPSNTGTLDETLVKEFKFQKESPTNRRKIKDKVTELLS